METLTRIRRPLEVIGRDPELTIWVMTRIARRQERNARAACRRRRIYQLICLPGRLVNWLTGRFIR